MRGPGLNLAVLLAALVAGCQAPGGPPRSSAAVIAQVPVAKTPHGIDAAKGFVYTGSIEGEAISVIDTRTDTLAKTIAMPGGQVVFLAAFPDGNHMLALDNRQGNVLVIDPERDHAVIQTIAVGQGPDEAFFAADGSVMVALADEDAIVKLTFQADRSIAPKRQTFPVGTAAGATNRHRPLAYQSGWAIVPNTGDNNATLTNLSTGEARSLADGNNPGPVALGAVDGAAHVAAVGYRASHSVVFYDLQGGGAPVQLTGHGLFPQAIATDEATRRAYVVMSGSDELSVYDYDKKQALSRVKVGSRPVELKLWPGMAGGGTEIWVGNDGGDSVSVIDAERLTLKATLGVGSGHHHLAAWGTKAYVSNLGSGTVTVIDRTLVK